MRSKRSKKCDISNEVRDIVRERDNDNCIWCGVHLEHPQLCHYISRQNGGLGIPENLTCGCARCHQERDQGVHVDWMREKQENYLKSIYPNWDKSKLKYKRKFTKFLEEKNDMD